MRLTLVVTLFILLGASLGIAHTWTQFSGIEERLELPAALVGENDGASTAVKPSQQSADTDGVPRAVVVGESRIDFGIMTRESSNNHSFVIRNVGDADLLVEKQNVSCGLCVHTTFTSATVRPGEEISIPVTLQARKPGPALNENLEVRTNDDAREVIRFDLIAYISEAAGASVTELALGTISTDEGGTANFRVFGFVDEPLEIVDCKLRDRDNRDYFEWQIADVAQEAVKAEQEHAVFGKEINLTIKPGLPVGPVHQEFTIVARAGKLVTIKVPMSGRVTGNLSLMGGSTFNEDHSLLSLGRILSGNGTSAKLTLMVKGEHRDEVEVKVGECSPAEYLDVTVGQRKPIRDGEAYLYPITVTVPPNLPTANHLGGVGASYGKIVLQTTHPTAKEVTLYVKFAVE